MTMVSSRDDHHVVRSSADVRVLAQLGGEVAQGLGGALALLFVLASTLLGPGVSGALAMVLLSLLALVLGLFLMAVLTVSVYASFRDIFGADDEPEATPDI